MADTGWKSPTATGGKYDNWENPTNAYASDEDYASRQAITFYKQSYESFDFGIPVGATINGIEVSVEGYDNETQNPVQYVNVYNNSSVAWATESDDLEWTAVESIITKGGATSLWEKDWIASDFSDENFSVYIHSGGGGQAVAYLNHIQVKVYYTEEKIIGPFPTHFNI